MADAWRGFVKDGHWDVDVNVRNFIQRNYTQYDGDESFLEGPTVHPGQSPHPWLLSEAHSYPEGS